MCKVFKVTNQQPTVYGPLCIAKHEASNLADAVAFLPNDVKLLNARDVDGKAPYWALVEVENGICYSNLGFYQ